ncbi:MAG: selenium cofactor biosynthesis protein YqeC, partial [Thermodesulfobacteriota bacterium]
MNHPCCEKKTVSFREALMLKTGGIISIVGAGGKTSLMHFLSRELSKWCGPVLATTTTKVKVPDPGVFSKIFISSSIETMIREMNKSGPRIVSPHFAASGEIPDRKKMTGLSPEIIEQLRDKTPYRWIIVEADGASQKSLKAPASHEPVIPDASKWVVAVAGLDGIGKPLTDEWVFRAALFSRLTDLKMGHDITEKSLAKALVHPEGVLKGSPADSRRIVFLNKADDGTGVDTGR